MVQMDASLLLYHVRQGGFLLSCALLFSFLVSCFLFLKMRTGV